MKITLGDWIQVTAEQIDEQDVDGHTLGVHVKRHAVGHVLNVAGDGWFDVFFERSGTISIVHESEIKRLCNANATDVEIGQITDLICPVVVAAQEDDELLPYGLEP
jgi:hypothetical protein